MDLNALEEALRGKDLVQEKIDFYISYANKLKMKNVPVIFDLEHLRQLLQIKKEAFVKIYYGVEHQYHYTYIPKNKDYNRTAISYSHDNTDYFRKLSLPSIKLKYIQRWILDNILYNIPVHDTAYGFIPNKSTITNACEHIGKEFLFKTDIKDFFPSISSKRVYGLFRYIGYNKSVSLALTKFCTYQNELPQGAPTSPYISNLICRKLDHRINELCKKHKLKYSRYADDITVSGGRKLQAIVPLIKEIVKTEDFSLNTEKTRIVHNSYKQKVTGVIVNQKASVPKELYRDIRQAIYYMRKFGVSSHLEWTKLYGKSNVKAYYYGLVNYCNMIDPVKGKKLYKELNQINWNS